MFKSEQQYKITKASFFRAAAISITHPIALLGGIPATAWTAFAAIGTQRSIAENADLFTNPMLVFNLANLACGCSLLLGTAVMAKVIFEEERETQSVAILPEKRSKRRHLLPFLGIFPLIVSFAA